MAIGFVVAFLGLSVVLPERSLLTRIFLAALIMFPVMGILYWVFESLKSWDERTSEGDKRERGG